MRTIERTRAELWRYHLPVAVGGSGVRSVDLLTLEVETNDGATGLGFSYVIGGADELPLAALRVLLDRHVSGAAFDHPARLWATIAAGFNRTGGGPYRTALAAIDVACWDLFARIAGVPIGVAMGGAPRRVPAYGSGGFTAHQPPEEAAAVARGHAARGLTAVKPRATGTAGDQALLEAVAGVAGVALMVDANERCTPEGAERLVRTAAAAGALFVEEPLPAGDVGAYRRLARISPVPLATGEHLRTLAAAEPFLHDRLCAFVQPDLQALGGLTPCLELARAAAARDVAVAPHFLPGLFIQLAAAAPNVAWLEEFPLLEPLFRGMPQAAPDGSFALPAAAGHGLELDAGARAAYALAG
jgi:L-alanine-DL-glutamate epimerase-like enolase superfamily enzyme